jgi:hypothetical protein
MDQAFTMMVDLIENTKFSLFLSFLFINGLAIVLSHFPIYTYYASDLNNSGDYTNWEKVYPLPFWPFKRFPVFVFTTNKDTGYTPDNWANYLRYSIGLLIHIVWIHFIISSFAPNLIFENFPLLPFKITIYALLTVPFVLYIIQKEKFTVLTATETKDGIPITEEQKKINGEKLNRRYKQLGIWYFIIATGSGLLILLTLLVGNFSPGGFILILLTSYLFVFNYVFFRLLRTRLSQVSNTLQHSLLAPVRFFFRRIHFLQKSENYILLFNFHFIISIIILVYSTLASIKGWSLSNGIPILLSFFYFYYFIIASLGKFFFVTKK